MLSLIPDGTTHVFANSKNKKSFYKNISKDNWEIYNKGLMSWEKIPSLNVDVIPLATFIQNEMNVSFNDTEVSCCVSITNVKTRSSILLEEFRSPTITPSDYSLLYGMFEKYSKGIPLGFTKGVDNFSLYYDHFTSDWKYVLHREEEYLTIYTSSADVIKKVVKELNSH